MAWKRNTENNEVRQYLLGNLSESARETLERRLLNEGEINEELQATEDELIDQYLGDRLEAHERKQFESHFLLPRERQRKLSFGRTLRAYLHSQPIATSNRDVSKSSLAYFLPLRWLAQRPVVVASLLLALGLAALGAYWLVSHTRSGNRAAGETLAITLTPGSSRANGDKTQRIEVPAAYGSVEVQLEMGTNEYPAYEVELLRERQSLNTYKSLHAQDREGRHVLSVIIPANELDPGDYTLKLSGTTNSGQTEYKDQYQLRVTAAR